MRENRYIRTITIAVALVFILALVGSASAGNAVQVMIKGNGKLVDGARIFESDNDAVAERTLEVTLNGPGKLAFFDAGTVHAENTDGSIQADVNVTKIEVSGKSTGTGTVVANATVKAEGHNIFDDVGALIGIETESLVESFVDLNAGAKGTAEGTAFAAGTATATGMLATGESVDTSATGTTLASGRVTGTTTSDLYAESEIEGFADVLTDGSIWGPDSFIGAEVTGNDASQGAAGASGSARADATDIDGTIFASSAEGAASASGTSTKGGSFDTQAGIEAYSERFGLTGWNRAGANIWTDVWTGGDSKTAKVTSSASASGETGAEILFPDIAPYYFAEAEGQAKGTASSSGIGESWADSEIEGHVSDFGSFFWEFPLPLDVPSGIEIEVFGDLIDDCFIESEVGATGDAAGFKGSASMSAAGEAESAGVLSDRVFSNSFAEGMTAAGASATGLGDAGSGSAIISLDVIGGGGFILLLDDADELPTTADMFATIDLPNSGLAEISVIADFAFANGESPKDIPKAAASASGETGAKGAIADFPTAVGGFVNEAQEDSFASGAVSATASTAAKADPFAASIIGSAVGLGSSNDMLDASLIAGFAEAEGARGQASASAGGFTSANGTVEFDLTVDNQDVVLESHTQAAGVTNASATANGGFALSFANIGSFNFENSLEDIPGVATSADLVDVSLIGGVSIADGKASALSSASGGTVSDGLFVAETEDDVELVNITGHSDAMSGGDTVETAVTSFGGFGLAAAGVGSVSTVDWMAGVQPIVGVIIPPSASLADVSLIGDLVVADGFGPKDTVKATASAEGFTSADGIVNDTSFDDLTFGMDGTSVALGEVSGKAVANQASDPVSLSAILSVNTAEVDNTYNSIDGTIDTTKSLVDVSTVTSASLATGKNGVASGEADGFTDATSAITLDTTVDAVTNTVLTSGTYAGGEESATAAVTSPGSLSLAIAGDTAVNVVVDRSSAPAEIVIGSVPFAAARDGLLPEMPEEFDMLLGQGSDEIERLSGEIEDSGLLGVDEMICDEFAASGLKFPIDGIVPGMSSTANAADPTLVSVAAGGTAAFSNGTGSAAGASDGGSSGSGTIFNVTDGELALHLYSNAVTDGASGADVRTFKGTALAASGIASVGLLTYEPPFVAGGLPVDDIIDVSVIGDIAFANGNEKTSSAKANTSATGFTNANGLIDDDVFSTSHSQAIGTASGTAEAKSISDPLTASLIGSFSGNSVNPLVTAADEDFAAVSLIASASFAADDNGKASGKASGDTSGNDDTTLEISGGIVTLASDTTASGTAATDVVVKDGFGIGVSAIGSVSHVHFTRIPEDVADVNDVSFMVDYAAGEGRQEQSSATTTGAVTNSSGEFNAESLGTDIVDIDSATSASGSGSATVQVSGGHQGEALSFMFADQNDFVETSLPPVSNAIAGFGVGVDGCNDSPVTSTATLTAGYLLADADADFSFVNDAAAHSEFTGIDALAQLQSSKNIATLTVADSVPDLSYEPAGGADVDDYDLVADTNSQPNLISYTRYGEAVSDENNLFVPDLQVLPILPY